VELLIAIVTTIVGAILGQAVSRWDSWRQTSSRGDLRGEWLAISHAGDHTSVRDKIMIEKKWGKLHFTNEGNDFGYRYEAYCTVELSNVLSGTWRSLRPGSASGGRVLMIVSPQGTSISGVYSGKTDDGRDVILGWVLARDADELEKAVQRSGHSFEFPKLPEV
jgi:hypothetical protein